MTDVWKSAKDFLREEDKEELSSLGFGIGFLGAAVIGYPEFSVIFGFGLSLILGNSEDD